jgi:hypothetical protein
MLGTSLSAEDAVSLSLDRHTVSASDRDRDRGRDRSAVTEDDIDVHNSEIQAILEGFAAAEDAAEEDAAALKRQRR